MSAFEPAINKIGLGETVLIWGNASYAASLSLLESKYISRKIKVNGGISYEILFSSLEPEIQKKLRENETKSTALVPLNYQPPTDFVSDKARLTSLSRTDIVKAALKIGKERKTKK